MSVRQRPPLGPRVRLAITIGDPAGVGPEVVLRAISTRAVAARVMPILVGDLGVWRDTAQRLGQRVRFCAPGSEAPGSVPVVVTSELAQRHRAPGPPPPGARAACGGAAYAAILEAVRLVEAGQAAGVVTAPISKAHLAAAGHAFPGHTELLAHLAGDVPVRMMMVGGQLRVVLVTTHVAIAQVPQRLNRESVLQTIVLTEQALRRQSECRISKVPGHGSGQRGHDVAAD